MQSLTSISEDTFADTFQPIRNHLNPHASFDWGTGFGTLFETYGEEAKFIASQPVAQVWTLLDSDEGLCIVSGWHFVNRLGYFVSKQPIPIHVSCEVSLEAVPD
jgi:hypothetical protein